VRSRALGFAVVLTAMALVHCGSNQDPLGGPFGGVATVVPAPGPGGGGGSSDGGADAAPAERVRVDSEGPTPERQGD
jgi:hypothetical protein